MPIKRNENLRRKIYNLLLSRGYDPVPKDSDIKNINKTVEPEEGDVIKFTFNNGNGEDDNCYIGLDGNNLTVYYDEDVMKNKVGSDSSEMDDSFFGFLKFLRQWSYSNGVKHFKLDNKDNLTSDMAQRTYMKKKEQIAEGYYSMGKQASYSDAVPTVKIILQHTRQIQEGEQRYRNVAKIFLENTQGERILAPTLRPGIAQVYARHLAEGGVPNDERWNHMKSLCEEYSKMAGFVRATKNHQFNESAQELVNTGVDHYIKLRETLGKLRGHKGYNTYFESWTPTLMEDEGDYNTINELFVQETMDPRIESVLPILNKLRKNVSEMKEVDELAEWADNLTEAPGAMTLKHNQNTEKSNLKAFDLEEDNVQDELKAAELAREKMKLHPTKRGPLSMGDIEASKKHPSSSGVVGRLADEPNKTTEEKDVEDTDLVMKLSQLTKAPDMFDAIYDALTSDDELGQHLQDMYFDIAREHRFHLDDDFEDIILKMADQLEHYYGEQGVAEGSNELDQQALAIADKLTTGKNLEKLRSMVHDSTVYRALDRYFEKHNIPETIYNRVAKIVFQRINQQGVAEGLTEEIPKSVRILTSMKDILGQYLTQKGAYGGNRLKDQLIPLLNMLNSEGEKNLAMSIMQMIRDAEMEDRRTKGMSWGIMSKGLLQKLPDLIQNRIKQGVAEGSLNEVTQGVEHSEWADNVKDHYHPTPVRIIKKRSEDGRHIGSHAMVADKKVGQYNMKTGVGTFTALKKQGVAEGSEQTNESLDRLLYLANIKTSKKKVDESIKSIVDTGSFSVEPSPIDRIDKVGGQDMSFDEDLRANTIKHLLQKNPSLSQDELKDKSTAELISMLREGVAEGLNDKKSTVTTFVTGCDWDKVVEWLEKNIGQTTLKSPNYINGWHGQGWALFLNPSRYEPGKLAFQVRANTDLSEEELKSKIEMFCKGVAEGMPASVIKSKQRYAKMTPTEFAQAHKDKSDDELISMAWRHGYGKGSKHYVDKRNKGKQGVSEGEFAGHYQTGPEGQWRNKGPKANKPAKVGDLVGASESFINTDPQSVVTEMDKSQPSSDRGGESSGNPYAKGGKATPIKAKDAEKDAEEAHKKDVKEGQEDLDAILRIIRK